MPKNFDPFLDRVSVRPHNADQYLIDEPELFVRILYDPHLQFSTGRHPAFEYFPSETENLIFDKLEENSQLPATPSILMFQSESLTY